MNSAGAPTPRELLAQADLMFLMTKLFDLAAARERLPSARDVDRLHQATGLVGDGGTALALALRIVRTTPPADRARENSRLFDGPTACPPNETAYVRRDKGVILADLCGFYRAFGFMPAEDTGEKPDHLAIELQFAGLLLVMLARAREDRETDWADIARDALRAFATDHLGAWLPAFCRTLGETARLGAHRALATALEKTWNALLARHGIEPTGHDRATGPTPERGTPYECGLCEGS